LPSGGSCSSDNHACACVVFVKATAITDRAADLTGDSASCAQPSVIVISTSPGAASIIESSQGPMTSIEEISKAIVSTVIAVGNGCTSTS
jgi:hypothetical protein